MNEPTRVVRVAVMFVFAVGACHFESSYKLEAAVDPGAPGPRFLDVCSDSAARACAYRRRCDSTSFEKQWPDVATCELRLTIACQLDASDANVDYDEAFLRACILPEEYPCLSDAGFEAAQKAFKERCTPKPGHVPNGGACLSDAACKEGFCFSDLGSDPLCGVCIAEPCKDGCPEEQACRVLFDGTSSCIRYGDPGAPCDESLECKSFSCYQGFCRALAKEGEPCVAENAPSCETGAYCDASSYVCKRLSTAKAHEPCGDTDGGLTFCIGGAVCPSYSPSPTCNPPVPDGFLCDEVQGIACLYPAACIGGYCRFRSLSCGGAD